MCGQITALFAKADSNSSGLLEFTEFCILIKGMNPKEPEGNSVLGFGGKPKDGDESKSGMFGALSNVGCVTLVWE